jgi:hypothetical protein
MFDYQDVLGNLSTMALERNRVARADSFTQEGLRVSRSVYGPDSRESALFLAHKGVIALTRGDTAGARVDLMRAVQIVDSIPEVVSTVRFLVHDAAARYWLVTGRPASADSLARQGLADAGQFVRGLPPIEAHVVYGATRLMVGAARDAEQEFLKARAIYDLSGTRIASWAISIRGGLAEAYDLQGKTAEAAAEYAQLPPETTKTLRAHVERLRSVARHR